MIVLPWPGATACAAPSASAASRTSSRRRSGSVEQPDDLRGESSIQLGRLGAERRIRPRCRGRGGAARADRQRGAANSSGELSRSRRVVGQPVTGAGSRHVGRRSASCGRRAATISRQPSRSPPMSRAAAPPVSASGRSKSPRSRHSTRSTSSAVLPVAEPGGGVGDARSTR